MFEVQGYRAKLSTVPYGFTFWYMDSCVSLSWGLKFGNFSRKLRRFRLFGVSMAAFACVCTPFDFNAFSFGL